MTRSDQSNKSSGGKTKLDENAKAHEQLHVQPQISSSISSRSQQPLSQVQLQASAWTTFRQQERKALEKKEKKEDFPTLGQPMQVLESALKSSGEDQQSSHQLKNSPWASFRQQEHKSSEKKKEDFPSLISAAQSQVTSKKINN